MPDISSRWADALDPSFKAVMAAWDKKYPKFYDKCANVESIDSNWVKDSYTSPMPTMPTLSDEVSAPTAYRLTQRLDKTYTTEEYGMIAKVSHVLQRDDISNTRIIKKIPTALSQSGRDAKEVAIANHFNRATSGSYLGPDGVALLSSVHPTAYYDGSSAQASTLSNTPGNVNLSETSLNDALVALRTANTEAGTKQVLIPKKLIIPSKLMITASKLLKSVGEPGTGNNDINYLKGVLEIVENPYITDENAWFIACDMNPLNLFVREELNLDSKMAVDGSRVALFGAYQSFISGWTHYLGIYGSAGLT